MKSLARQRKIRHAHLDAAKVYAKLSYANRLKVGAVLVNEDRVISIGRNGMPAGGSNKCERWELNDKDEMVTKQEVCHAELNAIAFAAKRGISTDGSTLVITHSPCFSCSKLLVQAGVKEVYYEKEYRDADPLLFLQQYKVKVERIET